MLPAVERITTAEAARRLGISSTQVRRRIAAGQLVAETEQRPQGTRLRVLWDATPDATSRADSGHGEATSDATYVATLERDNTWLKERLERAEEERAELRRLLLMEQQIVTALRSLLPAPRDVETPPEATIVASMDATSRNARTRPERHENGPVVAETVPESQP
jgi:predicted ArsR family transcriptional regulator